MSRGGGVFASESRGVDAPLPDGVGDVHDPGNGWQCWAVKKDHRYALQSKKDTQCGNTHRNGSKFCASHKGRKA